MCTFCIQFVSIFHYILYIVDWTSSMIPKSITTAVHKPNTPKRHLMDNFPKTSSAYFTSLRTFLQQSVPTNRSLEPTTTTDFYNVPISLFTIPGLMYKYLLQQDYKVEKEPIPDVLRTDDHFEWSPFKYEAGCCWTNTWHLIHVPKLNVSSNTKTEIRLKIKNDEQSCKQVHDLMVNYILSIVILSLRIHIYKNSNQC